MKIRHKLYWLCFALIGCSSAYAASSYNIKTEISSIVVYPQSSTSPSSVSYTELLINIPTDMSEKPSCAAHSNRFIIDSRNPLFDHVLSVALAARVAKIPVAIGYWDVCEASGTHQAPLIRHFTL
ncbi:hypothetical protein ABF162_14195 [Vibrio coralliilyticus]|uniref:hypothetical protein n=1 Tax=Vibrio coralliilyticus TaxID=190893 RepID=UPI0005126BCD|nr:hypothetical protein [Vibrio coralliilyticus]AIU68024.1 hypothetical protein JV59_38030 [Vibrio coralliilyticus]